MEKRQFLHMTVYCSAISPCGKYLAIGNNYGFISIYNIIHAMSTATQKTNNKPICIFKAHNGAIHALQTFSQFLVSSGCGPIFAWKWDDIILNKPSKAWTLKKDVDTLLNKQNEVYNCLACNFNDNILYSGGDDSSIVAWDLKTGLACETFTGHNAYIHDVDTGCNGLISGSEDGTVKVWDSRSSSCTKTFEPYRHEKLHRAQYGKWISCVAFDSNGQWVVCGGGPCSSLWHLRSGNLITALPDKSEKGGFSPKTITIYADEIIAGGNQSNIHRWYLNGQSKAVIPCTVPNVFSISFKHSQNKGKELPMVVTGTSYRINFFSNLGYLGSSFSLA